MPKRKKVRTREGGKRKRTDRPSSQKWKKYKIVGDKLEKGDFCPRCGEGVFMVDHGNRKSCGQCGYTVFKQ